MLPRLDFLSHEKKYQSLLPEKGVEQEMIHEKSREKSRVHSTSQTFPGIPFAASSSLIFSRRRLTTWEDSFAPGFSLSLFLLLNTMLRYSFFSVFVKKVLMVSSSSFLSFTCVVFSLQTLKNVAQEVVSLSPLRLQPLFAWNLTAFSADSGLFSLRKLQLARKNNTNREMSNFRRRNGLNPWFKSSRAELHSKGNTELKF